MNIKFNVNRFTKMMTILIFFQVYYVILLEIKLCTKRVQKYPLYRDFCVSSLVIRSVAVTRLAHACNLTPCFDYYLCRTQPNTDKIPRS